MITERPDQWRIDRLHEERGLWALDTARGVWCKTYDNGEYMTRREDFVFCGFTEAARIYAGGLVPVEPLIVDKSVDKARRAKSA